MALVTLILLLLLCAPVLHEIVAQPPAWLSRIAGEVEERRDPGMMWAVVYAAVSIVLTPLFISGTPDVVARVLGGLWVLLLALPEGGPQLVTRLSRKLGADTAANEAALESLSDILRGLGAARKALALIGLGIAVVLFAVVFR